MAAAPPKGIAGRGLRYALLLVLALFATLPGIASLPPVDRDEARFVQATKQMLQSGDFVDIRFQGVHRYKKPVGLYWLQAAAVRLTGHDSDSPIWAYRLVSVLGIVIAVLATYWTGARLFGATAGLVGGLVVAGMFAAAFEGRIAKTDAILLGFVVLAQGALAQIYVSARRGEHRRGSLPWIFWAAQGAAILTKGPIAPLLSLLTIAALSLFDREWRWLGRLRTGWGLPLAALIVLPWLAAITWKSGGAFWQESVGKDMLGKIGQGAESHWGPPGYYVLTYSLYLWPFGLLAAIAGLRALRQGRSDPAIRFLLAWYFPFWILLELIGTKLPHYVLPTYPAAALAIGWLVAAAPGRTSAEPWWEKLVRWGAATGLVIVTALLAAICVVAPIYLGDGFSLWSVPSAVLVIAAGYLAFPRAPPLSVGRVAAAAVTAAAGYALALGTILPAADAMWLSPRIAAAVAANRPCQTSVVASSSDHEPSLVFLLGTDTILTDVNGAAEHLVADPACALALVSHQDAQTAIGAAAAVGHTLQALATIDGINYSSGEKLSLVLYRVAP